MYRRDHNKTILRHKNLYKKILKYDENLTVNQICDELSISRSTYYNILKEFNVNDNNQTRNKQKHSISAGNISVDAPEDITQSYTLDNQCYLDNCPTNTGQLFDKDHELYGHMIIHHTGDVVRLSK